MQVIKPIEFQPSQLVSSNAVEAYSTWSSATTYAKDAYVDYGTYIYISLVNSNLNNQPDISPTHWTFIGPDNTHAMFDAEVGTQTTSTSPLTVNVTPGGSFNTLAIINVEAGEARLKVRETPGGTIIYDVTKSLYTVDIIDWYMYFFADLSLMSDFVFSGIPPYSTSNYELTLSGLSTVKIGHVACGIVYELGNVEYGATTGIKDFSVKQTDDFGVATFVKRGFSKRFEGNLFVLNSNVSPTVNLLSELRATPAVWIPVPDSTDFSSLLFYGYYKEFNMEIRYPSYTMCSIQLEGLI